MKPTFDKTRPLSWSAISSFEYNPEQWYDKYVLKLAQPSSKEMDFGKEIGEKLASDPKFLPHVERYEVFEQELRCVLFFKKENIKISLVGYMDTAQLKAFKMREYKTGKKPWTQKRADDHGQIDMYLLMIEEIHKINPEDMMCHIDWMPTIDVEPEHDSFDSFKNGSSKTTIGFVDETQVKSFETRRTKTQILKFRTRILKTFLAMEEYAKNHD